MQGLKGLRLESDVEKVDGDLKRRSFKDDRKEINFHLRCNKPISL